MKDLLTDSELERLKSYMPPGWREQIGPSPTLDEAMGYVFYLQELVPATDTYVPRALLMTGTFVTEAGFDPLIARPITDVVLAEPTVSKHVLASSFERIHQ